MHNTVESIERTTESRRAVAIHDDGREPVAGSEDDRWPEGSKDSGQRGAGRGRAAAAGGERAGGGERGAGRRPGARTTVGRPGARTAAGGEHGGVKVHGCPHAWFW